MGEDAEVVSERVRTTLNVTYEGQAQWRSSYIALRQWRQRLEAMGVLVFQISGIDSSEVRGFSFAEDVAPVIAINRGETPNARIFSVMHELVHLMLRQSSICDFEEEGGRAAADEATEVYCNRVAAAILVPRATFEREEVLRAAPPGILVWGDAEIAALANTYRVSREVIVRRLVTIGRSPEAFYRQKRNEYLAQYRARQDAPKEPVPENYGRKRASILGNFARLVLESYYQDKITLSDASGYLGIKLKYLADLERAVGVA
jgi:Zn-dependent peptidase ImmA (M78 family)